MRSTRCALAVAAILAAATLAPAQTPVDQTWPAAKNALVEIQNPAGSVTIKAWDRLEVTVKGTLGKGAEKLEFSGDRLRLHLTAKAPSHERPPESDLVVNVPAGGRVQVTGLSTRIDVAGVAGPVSTQTIDGGVTVSGAAEVEVKTVNGPVEVTGTKKRVQVNAVNGDATVKGGSGTVHASTVDGTVVVSGTALESVRLNSVQGSVRFEGRLPAGASLHAHSVGGTVTLAIPASNGVDYTVGTMSGTIKNDLSDAAPKETIARKELSFSTSGGGATVQVDTLSGTVHLVKP
jgi:hypothetical protein